MRVSGFKASDLHRIEPGTQVSPHHVFRVSTFRGSVALAPQIPDPADSVNYCKPVGAPRVRDRRFSTFVGFEDRLDAAAFVFERSQIMELCEVEGSFKQTLYKAHMHRKNKSERIIKDSIPLGWTQFACPADPRDYAQTFHVAVCRSLNGALLQIPCDTCSAPIEYGGDTVYVPSYFRNLDPVGWLRLLEFPKMPLSISHAIEGQVPLEIYGAVGTIDGRWEPMILEQGLAFFYDYEMPCGSSLVMGVRLLDILSVEEHFISEDAEPEHYPKECAWVGLSWEPTRLLYPDDPIPELEIRPAPWEMKQVLNQMGLT